MVIFLTSIIGLIFIPLSPLVVMSSILSIKSYRESDVKYCEMAGVINIYFAIKIFITKNRAK